MSANIQLKDLSLQQVCNLLPHINFRTLVTIVEEKEINGLALDSVENLEELVEVFSTIPAFKIKALFRTIMELKETGVSPDLLLPPPTPVDTSALPPPTPVVITASTEIVDTSASTATSTFAQIQARYMMIDGEYNTSPKIPFRTLLLQFISIPITFLEAIGDIDSTLAKGPIGELTLCQFKIAARIAIDHADNWTIYNGPTSLSSDEIASIAIYSMDTPFFSEMNALLRAAGRNKITPFLKYLMLLNRALAKCPKPEGNITVFRGFATNVSSFYEVGKEFNWAQLSSSTLSYQTARDFLSNTPNKLSTMFKITIPSGVDCARSISKYSILPNEDEILFVLMARFKVTASVIEDGVITIYLEAIPPTEDILHIEEQSGPYAAVLNNWECPTCTFINSGTINICESCGTNCSKAPQVQVPQVQVPPVQVPQVQVPQNAQVVKNFTFTELFDKNLFEHGGFNIDGVLYHIGTRGGTQLYQNPHEAGYVVASRSSDGIFGGGDIKNLVGRTSEINTTADKPNSSMSVDLGANRSLVINHFCLRYGWSSTSAGIHFPQNFEIQGSNDGTKWEMIQRFEGDTFNEAPACSSPNNFGKNQPWAHWAITTLNVGSFRHFCILQFGPHQGGRHVLALSGLELYGELTETN